MKLEPLEFELEGLRLRGWRRPGPGPRCLAVHGWLDNSGSFAPLAEAMPQWDLVALDLPGHGRSDWLPQPSFYHFIDGVHWITQAAERWKPQYLMGHSLGGGLCSLAAGVLEDLEGAILLDALGPLVSPGDEARDLFLQACHSWAKPFRRRYYPSYVEAQARLVAEGRSPQAAEALAERSLMCDDQGYYFSYDPRVKAVSRLRITEEQVQSYLSAIACPVQILSFSQGYLPVFPPLQERLKCLQQGYFLEMEGSHHLHLENPQAVAQAVLAFGEATGG